MGGEDYRALELLEGGTSGGEAGLSAQNAHSCLKRASGFTSKVRESHFPYNLKKIWENWKGYNAAPLGRGGPRSGRCSKTR